MSRRLSAVIVLVASLAGSVASLACGSFGADTPADAADAANGLDGGAVDAAPADASSSVDAGARFCQQKTHAFCVDFDEGAKPWSFDRTVESKDGGVAVESLETTPNDDPRSLPNALHARLEPTGVNAYLSVIVPAASNMLHVEVDVRARQRVATVVGLVGVRFAENRFVIGADGDFLYLGMQNGSTSSGMKTTAAIADAWLHLVFDYDLSSGTVALHTDGVTVKDGFVAPIKLASETSVTLTLGLESSSFLLPSASDVLFDNFAVTWR